MADLWRAVDAEGEVSIGWSSPGETSTAALKLMRTLLKKHAFAPGGWSPTTCDHTAPRLKTLGSNAGMSADDGRTIEL